MPVSSKPDSKLSSGLKKVATDTTTKNLSHVPCKFFKQGACQAGKACPFSHTLDAQEQAPCKYFQKGNCKFGSKCALAHILPDGKRVATSGTGGKRKHREKFGVQQGQAPTQGQTQGQVQGQSQPQSQPPSHSQPQSLSQSQAQSPSHILSSQAQAGQQHHIPQQAQFLQQQDQQLHSIFQGHQGTNTAQQQLHNVPSFGAHQKELPEKKTPGQIPVFQPSSMFSAFNGSMSQPNPASGGLGARNATSPTNDSTSSSMFFTAGSVATSRLTGSAGSTNNSVMGGISSPIAASPIGSGSQSGSASAGRGLYNVFGGSPYNQNSFSQDSRLSLATSPPSRSLSMSIWNEPQRGGRSPSQSQGQTQNQSQSFTQSQFYSHSMHTSSTQGQIQGLGFTHGHSNLLNGSAILDDDSEDEGDDTDFDLVPSSLNELLTPSERQRRSSSHAASQMPILGANTIAISSANGSGPGSGSASLIDPIGTPTNSTPLKSTTPAANKLNFNMFNSPPRTLPFASLASAGLAQSSKLGGLNQSAKPAATNSTSTSAGTAQGQSQNATPSSSALFDDDTQFLMDEVYKR